ncbi:hypothetical protein [Helicobacter suis]|uniref:hypothetical protein n=1 Tax=Helicobacter suis TaxID=104628 RepID=UPI0013D1BA75|nr:hypothetical protein [Helicobacter suis]
MSLPSHSNKPLYFIYLILAVAASLAMGVYKSLEISVSYREALLYFSTPETLLDRYLLQALHTFVRLAYFLPKDLALRLPGLFFHALNIILIYLLSLKEKPQKPYDPLFVALTFGLLPGVQLGAILLGKASLLITLSLLSLLAYRTWLFYVLSLLVALLDASYVVLLTGFFLYAFKHKQMTHMLILFLALWINLYAFKSVSGTPQGFFLNTLFTMLILYSPCLCIYYPYALYTQAIKEYKQDSLIGVVGAVGFLLPLLLSLRQELPPEFLSYGPLGMPILLQKALSSIRLHLPIFRSHYYIRYSLVFGTLLLESMFLWGGYNKFVSTHYVAKELALALHKRGIETINTTSPRIALRLRFYGINSGGNLFLIEQSKHATIKIYYKNKVAASYAILRKKPLMP